MFGGRSIEIARVFGIRVGVHATWFVVLFVAILWVQGEFERVLGDSTQGFVAAAIAALLFFGSILLHELGHAFAARRAGIGVEGVDLFFFGGMMHMSRDTQTPGEEFRVAVAGPLATLGVVLVSGAASLALDGDVDGILDLLRFSVTASMAELIVTFLFVMNVFLLAFNLIPAFPLDGGRIARSIAWRATGNRAKATRWSAFLGQAFAVILMGVGVYQILGGDLYGGLWSLVLGWMLGGAARAAVAQSAVTAKLEGITVADVMDADPVTIPAELPSGQAWEEYFLRYQGWPWFAVVEADGRFAGLAQRGAVESAPPDLPVRSVASVGEAISTEDPIEALLSSEPLRSRGALMAVDADGRLRGVVTLEMVTRVLQARLQPTTPA